MRRRTLVIAAIIAAATAACADILGIDDGIPRTPDASLDAPSDATIDAKEGGSDAGPEAAFSPLSCGTGTTCNFAAGEACCRTGSTTYKCVDASASCTGTYIPCDRPEQCPQNTEAGAMQCCTNNVLDDASIYVVQSVSCVPAGKCAPIPNHYIMCGDDSGADCPPEAGCGPSTSALPPFLICK